MPKALIVLHAPPDTPDCRALTALRLAGAMLADSKDVHLFLVEEGARRAELPKDKPILLYCNSGSLSGQAAFALKLAGVGNVLILQGGFYQWKEEGGFDASHRATQPSKH